MDYNSFSRIVSATKENILEFCLESNLIEGVDEDNPASPFVSQHLAAFDYARNNKKISIRELHRILMNGLIDVKGEEAGEYRKHHVRIGRHVHPPPGYVVESLMGGLEEDMEVALLKGYRQHTEWELHNRFEVVHPFVDGNGRTGRLLLNHVRMKYFPEKLLLSILRTGTCIIKCWTSTG
ncbi:MAG: Fic family protein [Candidatus Aenigmatarchaeota archaeon]